MSFKMNMLLDGHNIEVEVSKDSLNAFMGSKYPEVASNQRFAFFCKKYNATVADPITPPPRTPDEPVVKESDFLWITSPGDGVKDALNKAKEDSLHYAGEDAFILEFKRYLIVDTTMPSLENALKSLPRISERPLRPRTLGVILLDFDYFLFFTTRDLYLRMKEYRATHSNKDTP